MQDRQGQTVPESPRPVHGPWHGLSASKVIGHMHEASWNVEQTCVYPAKNSVDAKETGGLPNMSQTK